MDPVHILYFLAVSVAITLLPGPDILFVIAQSMSRGKNAGIATALGLCTGLIVHTLAAALGVAAILHQSAIAFAVLKYAGALYLLYLAWQAARDGKATFDLPQTERRSHSALYRKGIFMNLLNPKVSLFFLAFLPQFVPPSAENAVWQMMLLGVLFLLQALAVFTAVSIFAGMIGQRWLRRPAVARHVNKVKAALFAILGIRLALMER
jgi:RhtB (resistance to homoserine/threonine) family protein